MENTSLISYIYSTFIISFRALLDLDNYSLVVLNSRIVSSTTQIEQTNNKMSFFTTFMKNVKVNDEKSNITGKFIILNF